MTTAIKTTVLIAVGLPDATLPLVEQLCGTSVNPGSDGAGKHSQVQRLIKFLQDCNAGVFASSISTRIYTVGTCAKGTLTAGSTAQNGDTVVVNGRTFTFKTTPNPDNPQEVALGASAAASTTNIFNALQYDPFVSSLCYVTNPTSTTVVLTARVPGAWASTATTGITTTSTGGRLTWGAGQLASGVDPTLATSGAGNVYSNYTPETNT